MRRWQTFVKQRSWAVLTFHGFSLHCISTLSALLLKHQLEVKSFRIDLLHLIEAMCKVAPLN